MIKLCMDVIRVEPINMMVTTEDGERINNCELPEDEQIRIECSTPSTSEKVYYVQERTEKGVTTRKYREEAAVKKHCVKLYGLEKYNIIDGKTLCNAPKSKDIVELITAIFMHIMGAVEEEEA